MSKSEINLPRQFRAATIATDSFSNELNTVDLVWTTGADVLRWDGREYYIERLSTDPKHIRLERLNKNAPFLDTHNDLNLSTIIGCVVPGTAEMINGRGVASVKLSQSARAADTVTDIRTGIICNVSMGYSVYRFERTDATDDTPAIMLAVDYEPFEISAVPIPADPDAQISVRARSAYGVEINSCTILRSLVDETITQIDLEEAVVADDKTTDDAKDKDVRAEDTSDKVDAKKDEVKKEDKDDKADDCERSMPKGDELKRMMERVAHEAFERGWAEECVRQSEIMKLARRHGLEDLGVEHCHLRTKVQSFKDALLDKLADTSARNAPALNAVRDGSPEPKEDFAFARKFYKTK